MTIKKKPLNVQLMESSIQECVNELDEVFALMVMFRNYARSEHMNQYTLMNGFEGIFTRLIEIQSALVEHSSLEE